MRLLVFPIVLFITFAERPAAAGNVDALIGKIRAVGKKGEGNVAAAQAMRKLTAEGPDVIVNILAGMDGAGPLAINYLRSAAETIAGRTLARKKELPVKQLRRFLLDTRRSGKGRRLAYELLLRIDPKTADVYLPQFVDDPSAELRRDAVARLIEKAEAHLKKSTGDDARKGFEIALKYARDHDQVEKIAGKLKKLGREVDLTKHFGFITRWMVIAPFDNHNEIGYKIVYPPEREVNLRATYKGKGGKKAAWQLHVTKEKMGVVDFNQIFGDWHGVAVFAHTVVDSPKEQACEIRASSNNAVMIFLNGKKIYGREEYHHGKRMDQHIASGALKKGRNDILVKVLQNEQTETWAQQWSFNLRVTDHLGAPLPLAVLTGKR